MSRTPDGSEHPRVLATATAHPPHRYPQTEITAEFAKVVGGRDSAATDLRVVARIHEATQVRARHLALPLEAYAGLDGFGASNDAWIRVAGDLGEKAVRTALDRAGLSAADVDLLLTTSVTGIAAPSLDARLVPRLGLRPDVRRLPVFGLGCVAGAAGVARVAEWLRGSPDSVAVLLAVELCSLTVQRDDTSMANIVGSGLFGDGAAAVVMAGARRAARLLASQPTVPYGAQPVVVASRSRFYPDTERVMGWDVGGSGFRIVLAASVADVVEEHLGDDVRGFFEDHDVKADDIATWVAHPGGPKVLDAMERALGLAPDALDATWESLRSLGNLSSVSVLDVLRRTMAGDGPAGVPAAGAPGLLLAMGPGFCAELVLLQW